jgi:glutamyl-tRNA synthetase
LVRKHLADRGVQVSDAPKLEEVIALYKERTATLLELADEAEVFYIEIHPTQELLDTHLVPEVMLALRDLAKRFSDVAWEAPALAVLIKEMLAKHNLKMPKLAMPLRVMLVGQTHTPSVDTVLALFPRETVLARINKYL